MLHVRRQRKASGRAKQSNKNAEGEISADLQPTAVQASVDMFAKIRPKAVAALADVKPEVIEANVDKFANIKPKAIESVRPI